MLLGCSCSNTHYSAPSSNEINKFIEENNLNVVAAENIEDVISVIIFKNKGSAGYYMLYKDGSGTLRDKKVWGELLENSPVYLSGSATNYPFVTILLNEKLMKDASYAEVTFRDGTKVTKKFNNSTGLICSVWKGHLWGYANEQFCNLRQFKFSYLQ